MSSLDLDPPDCQWCFLAMCVMATAFVFAHVGRMSNDRWRAVSRSVLASVPEMEGTIVRVERPQAAPRMALSHGRRLPVLISGEFVVNVHGQSRERCDARRVYHEAVHTTKHARNGSASRSAELILFQVGCRASR